MNPLKERDNHTIQKAQRIGICLIYWRIKKIKETLNGLIGPWFIRFTQAWICYLSLDVSFKQLSGLNKRV